MEKYYTYTLANEDDSGIFIEQIQVVVSYARPPIDEFTTVSGELYYGYGRLDYEFNKDNYSDYPITDLTAVISGIATTGYFIL